MSKSKIGRSDKERELFGIAEERSYVRTFAKPTKRHTPNVVPSDVVKVELPATLAPMISEVSGPASMEVVEPVDVMPPEALAPDCLRTGTIRYISADNLHGFITMHDDTCDVYFSHKCCYGLMRAFRPGDEVTFLMHEGTKGFWAREVERVRK